MNPSDELNQFKTSVNLIDYAASLGYYIDKQESSRSNVVMRDDQNDKIIITRQSNTQHWIYWSDRDQADKGTIIDFIQKRLRLSLGEVRKEIRSWTGTVQPTFIHPVLQSSPNLEKVRAAYDGMNFIQEHPYLLNQRHIPLSTLHHKKFAKRIKIDRHRNAIFPHFCQAQVCGYEIKNLHFTGFSPHGQRGLWCSVWHPSDMSLIITESAIDALSFHTLHGTDKDFYVSLGGQLGKKQISLIKRAAKEIISHSGVVTIATDNDTQGQHYYHLIAEALNDVKANRFLPVHKDWNDDLRNN